MSCGTAKFFSPDGLDSAVLTTIWLTSKTKSELNLSKRLNDLIMFSPKKLQK